MACRAARVGRTSHYRWLAEAPAYREALEHAKDDAIDILEAEAHRRAVRGVRKPAGWYKGKAGGTVVEFSDNLLMFTLKALRPEKYRERIEVGGSLAHIDVTKLTNEELARMSAREPIIQVLGSRMFPPGATPAPAPVSRQLPPARNDGATP